MKSPSLISILIPAYNHEKYVEGCVRSVLVQDWPNVELLVVDDGSKDATWAKLQGLKAECERRLARVEMVTQENRGTSFTWARLREMAHGDFILTLASDDELAPGALSALVKPMLKDGRIGVVVGQNAFMDGEGRTCYWNRALETVYDESEARYRSLNEAICSFAGVKQFSRQFGDYGRLLKDNYIANGCLIRASELAAVKFPAEQVPLEDYWVHLQLSKRTRYKAIHETTFRYRWHQANTSHLREKMKEMTRRIYDFEEKQLKAAGDSCHLAVFNEVRSGVPCSVWGHCLRSIRLVKYGKMKKTYDLVLGLGPACSCSQTLRKAGLQHLSLPFDWLIYTNNLVLHPGDLPRKIDDICARFDHWFDRWDFECVLRKADGNVVSYNHRTTCVFPHDFHSQEELDRDFGRVKSKYQRRIDRLLNLLEHAKEVLLVRLDAPPGQPPTPEDDCRYAREKMSKAFAGTSFDIVYFRCEKGRSFEDRMDREIEPGFRQIAFDYHDYSTGKPSYEVLLGLTARALCEHAAVRDYRTKAERSRGRWKAIRKFLHLK